MTATPIPGVRYYYDDANNAFVAPGRPSIPGPPPPAGISRNTLTAGTYIPGITVVPGMPNNSTVGMLDLTNLSVLPGNASGIISINSVPADGYIRNTIFKGKVVPAVPVKFSNCWFANRDPQQVNTEGTGNGGCIQNFGSNPPFVQIYDSLLDPFWWYTSGTISDPGNGLKGSPLYVGIHGGNMLVDRCEIRNVQDGMELVGPTLQSAHDAASFTMRNSWVHKMAYFQPWPAGVPLSPASGDTHSDAVQFNTHPNVLLEYNMLGGLVDYAGYDSNPAYNSGDDAHNAAIIMAQEGSAAANVAVTNVTIRNNWLAGGGDGGATVNLFLKNGNNGSTWNFLNNKVARRGLTRGTATVSGNGFTFYVSTGLACPFLTSGGAGYNTNVVWDPLTGSMDGTGVPAPIVRY